MMDAAALSALIDAKVTAAGFDVSNPKSSFHVLSQAIAEAVVEHLTANASVDGGVCAPGGPVAGAKIT